MATCPKCRAHYADDLQHCEVDGELLLPDVAVANFDGELAPGDLVGEYRVEKKIGEGGFGKVYSAVHPVIGKRAAIKVLNREFSSNVTVVSRFVSEARAVNQIRHRNIIDIFSFGSLPGGLQYLVMELLEGETLDAYLEKNKRIAPSQALPILHRIARALDAAHAAGIAHRDLKPENVFLCYDDEGGVYPKLLDFGIAKLMGDTAVNHKTRTGAAMGTPLYMSPEQCRGKGVDHRTDLYSFGVMIHEVLTGRLPFDGDSMMDLMFKHAQAPPPPMSTMNPDLPVALDAPVLRMLEKSPDDRPPTVTAAVQAIIDAAHSAGIEVAVKRSTTLSGSGSGEGRGLPSTNSGEVTMGVANTLQTVETVDAKPSASGSRAWIAAAAALVVGGAVMFIVTRGGPESAASPAAVGAPASSATPPGERPADPQADPMPTPPEPADTSSAAAAKSTTPDASASAASEPPPAPGPAPPRPVAVQPPPPPPPPPPLPTPPKPPPSDLEPF